MFSLCVLSSCMFLPHQIRFAAGVFGQGERSPLRDGRLHVLRPSGHHADPRLADHLRHGVGVGRDGGQVGRWHRRVSAAASRFQWCVFDGACSNRLLTISPFEQASATSSRPSCPTYRRWSRCSARWTRQWCAALRLSVVSASLVRGSPQSSAFFVLDRCLPKGAPEMLHALHSPQNIIFEICVCLRLLLSLLLSDH